MSTSRGTVSNSVEFTVSVYKKSRAFSVPKRIQDLLGISGGDSVHLIVRTPSGKVLFSGRKTLKSGPEIYGQDIATALTPGSVIMVDASDPLFSEVGAEARTFEAQEVGAGFQSNPEIRRVVEEHAMKRAREKLVGLGFSKFDNTSKRKCYDYTCEKTGSLYYVEVKGTQGRGESIVLTRNEVEHWRAHQQNSIAVIVHNVVVNLGINILD